MFVRFSFQVHGLEKTSGSGRPGQVREGKDQHSFTGSIFQYCCLEENLRNQEWRAEQSRGSSRLWSVAVVQGNLGSLSVTVLPGSYHLQGWMSVDTGQGQDLRSWQMQHHTGSPCVWASHTTITEIQVAKAPDFPLMSQGNTTCWTDTSNMSGGYHREVDFIFVRSPIGGVGGQRKMVMDSAIRLPGLSSCLNTD